jgi:small subunit ribosomal protein S4
MHGAKRSQRLSEYGVRMREKQRLKAHYSVLEKQFRRYMTAAKKAKGNTAVTLQQLLEMRLDNVVRRLGVVRSIWAARQLVAHGHVKLNGKKCEVPVKKILAGVAPDKAVSRGALQNPDALAPFLALAPGGS